MNKVAIALGGGGARGLAHIGFLKILDQNKIKINSISGCSMGAVVGGLYAYFGNAAAVEEFVLKIINSEKYKKIVIDDLGKRNDDEKTNYLEQFFDFIGTSIQLLKAVKSTSYFDEEFFNEIFDFIPDVPIETLKIKLFVVASDLLSGNKIILSKGSLKKALQASAAIPGIFPPVKYHKYLLVDGSVTDLVPVDILKKSGYEKVIAVNVVRSLENPNPPKNILEVLYRVEGISSFHLSAYHLKDADILINPDVRKYNWSEFRFAKEIIEQGEIAALDHLDDIFEIVNKNIILFRFRKLINRIKNK